MNHPTYQVFDNMIEGVQVIDRNWQYVYVNNAVAEHGKTTREKLLGQSMIAMYPGIEKTEMFRLLQRCMQEREGHKIINKFDFPDGSCGYFELRIQPVPEGVLVLSVDITEQKN